MASRRSQDSEEIEEDLDTLEVDIKRLRIEYEQFFKGVMKREPQQLLGKVQKTITRFAADPPRRVALKFRFNSLVARFQSLRQLWGRTMRQIEAGTYGADQFKLRLHERQRENQARAEEAEKAKQKPEAAVSPLDKLREALMLARRETGETDPVNATRLAETVQRQKEAIRQKYGRDARITFKVVVEKGRAKLLASVKRRKAS